MILIDDGYADYFGRYRAASPQTKRAIAAAVGPEDDADAAVEPVYVVRAGAPASGIPGVPSGERFEPGYYEHDAGGERTLIIAAPPHAYVPEGLDEHPRWGIAAQLYSLRSNRNWGIGDFGDLRSMAAIAADSGAACVALNPLHALDLSNPRAASPYSPISRLFLNPLYIDVPQAYEALGAGSWKGGGIDGAHLRALRETDLVDYERVANAKLRALRALHGRVNERAQAASRFRAFAAEGGERLKNVAIYQAIMAHRKARDPQTYGWMQWPPELQDPHSAAVAAFASAHAGDVEFYAFLQWLADEQLAAAARSTSGMTLGLYRDLAVGADAGSADVWMDREAFCKGIYVGAPPDALNEHGQNWRLPPFNPRVLRRRAYAPFIELLRANMRHAGALRIDHVMGLMRLFCIPAGMPSEDGTYLRYPFEDLLGVLALESFRNRCTIVGEDLGTVPGGFRERMARARVFSCRLLYFENDPRAYPRDAVASTGTHDLPPLRKYWEQHAVVSQHTGDAAVLELAVNTYRTLGASPARLVLAQMEDVLLAREQVNAPGTVEGNWQHKLSVKLEDLQDDDRFQAVAEALRETRGDE